MGEVMTYDYEIKLLSKTTTVDEIGDTVVVIIEKPIFADILNYRSKDFYQALASGLKPSITFGVNKYEYENEKELIHEGKKYKIIDVSPIKAKDESEFDSIALICEGVMI